MKNLLNKNVTSINMDNFQTVMKEVSRKENVIDLTLGQPNFETPSYIKKAGIEAISNNHSGYTDFLGLYDLRKEASKYMNRLYDLNYDPESEVIITIGASEALDLTFRTILEEDSEVIIPTPVYVGYEPLVQMAGGKPVLINTVHHDFKLTADLLKKHITNKTRAVILPYPNNPMGALLSQTELEDLANLLANKDIFIVTDEIYSELHYQDRHYSIASFEQVRDQTIMINGLSKSHAMTGWRIGFAFAPSFIIDAFLKIKMFSTVCATSISQYAAVAALKNEQMSDKEVLDMKKDYIKRRDYVYNRLLAMGLYVTLPEGAFYIFPSIQNTGLSSVEFSLQLLKEENVAVIPGSAFSNDGEGFIRISYAQSMDKLEKGMDGLEKFINSFSN